MITNEAIKEEVLKIQNPATGEVIGQCGEKVVVETDESLIKITLLVGYPMKSFEVNLAQLIVKELGSLRVRKR